MSQITKYSNLAKAQPDENQLKAMAFHLGQSLAKVDKIETNQTQLSQKFSEMNERLSRIESRGLQAQTPYELPDKPTKPYNPNSLMNNENAKSLFLVIILGLGIMGVAVLGRSLDLILNNQKPAYRATQHHEILQTW